MKIAYSIDDLATGMVEPNVTNYKQIIQRVSEHGCKPASKLRNSMFAQRRVKKPNPDFHLQGRYRKYDKEEHRYKNKYIVS